MSKYQTSEYLSIGLNYNLAADWWALSSEQHDFVYSFLNDWDVFEAWLDEHNASFEAYKAGGKSRQQTITNHPEHYPLFVYAHWLHLQNGALLNTLLLQYGYVDVCSTKRAYEPAADFFELLLAEYQKLNIVPPSLFDVAAESNALNAHLQTKEEG